MTLSSLGWDDFFARGFARFTDEGLVPARVTLEHKNAYELLTPSGELSGCCTGRLLHMAGSRADLPAVGDWVAVRPRYGETRADIHALVPRRTVFSRRAVDGSGDRQIVAANVDTVFLVTGLDQNYSLRRIERYLTAAWESGAQPVVVLNKADLHPDPAAAQVEVEGVASGAPVVVLSALADAVESGGRDGSPAAGLEALSPWLRPTTTVAFLGSSGVGKSTLINRILGGEHQLTAAVSAAVGKGRHTTSRRELMVAPSGVLVIDTPGMRELQLWDPTPAAIDASFADIAALAARCRFRDCAHKGEPGCAIEAALRLGELGLDRWHSFQKLQREQAYVARKADPRKAIEQRAFWKRIHKDFRARQRREERE